VKRRTVKRRTVKQRTAKQKTAKQKTAKQKILTALLIGTALAVAVSAGAAASSANFGEPGCNGGSGGSGSGGCCGTEGGSGDDCTSYTSPYPQIPNRLYGVAGTSASDVWAAGIGSPGRSLIMHWNGSSWTTSFTDPVGYFQGMAAVTASNAWAVGATAWFGETHTLAEHWNGTSWTQTATPTPGSGVLNAVAATSASNAWAVGVIGPGDGTTATATEPLIEHWNGTSWAEQTFADPTGGGQFAAVAARSADDAWAVGWVGGTTSVVGATTLIDHWDGSSWTRVPSPNPSGSGSELKGVVAISASDAWAVGLTQTSDNRWVSLTMHWDGSDWNIVSSPNPDGDAVLGGVSAASASDVWAVGVINASPTTCGPHCLTLAMHWDGSSWTVVPTPNPPSGYLNALLGVAVIAGDDVWAVGSTDFGKTLFSHWDGSSWR
jgi:hypothetical protein